MSYLNWADVVARYKGLASFGDASEVNSVLCYHAENRLHSMLGGHFTVPFSSNNLTAIDLAIDLLYLHLMLPQNPKQVDMFKTDFDNRIKNLKVGIDHMITSSGDLITADALGQAAVHSSHEDYSPSFDYDNPIDWEISPDLVADVGNARD